MLICCSGSCCAPWRSHHLEPAGGQKGFTWAQSFPLCDFRFSFRRESKLLSVDRSEAAACRLHLFRAVWGRHCSVGGAHRDLGDVRASSALPLSSSPELTGMPGLVWRRKKRRFVFFLTFFPAEVPQSCCLSPVCAQQLVVCCLQR